MQLRDYQQRAIDQLYDWFISNQTGNPCLVLPTGSGKSHIVSALCKDAVQNWPETRVLMLTHQKELIEQNAEKMRQHWRGAPLGIYSASIGKRQFGEPITFAGIQSVRKKGEQLGHVDIVIIDECHLINHADTGGYRTLLEQLKSINPALRVIGLTATPYRLGHGLITEKPALFDALIEPVSIEELVFKGHLSTLRSKITGLKLDVSEVHKRGGEFIESELQAAVNTNKNNAVVVAEVMRFGEHRNSWLFFCAGVDHAEAIASLLEANGITARCITGATPKKEREETLAAFKAGGIRALTNANVLTTGFDAPGIDLIAMLRPTMSASLYVQMAGRGMRVADGKADCLVLDFAGVVESHGPITAVIPPGKGKKTDGPPPVKVCPDCAELVALSARQCPACGFEFPAPPLKKMALRDDDIMGMEGTTMQVKSWRWDKHISRTSGKEMLRVRYYGSLHQEPVTEYFTIMHEGYGGDKARREFKNVSIFAGVSFDSMELDDMAQKMNVSGTPPQEIEFRKDGKFHRIQNRRWS